MSVIFEQIVVYSALCCPATLNNRALADVINCTSIVTQCTLPVERRHIIEMIRKYSPAHCVTCSMSTLKSMGFRLGFYFGESFSLLATIALADCVDP